MSSDPTYIYADNAATTRLSPAALDAMMPYLTDVFGNPSGIHRIARDAARALDAARRSLARSLGRSRMKCLSRVEGRNRTPGYSAAPLHAREK